MHTLSNCEMKLLQPFGLQISANKSHADFASLLKGEALSALVQQHHLVLLRGFAALQKEKLVNYAASIGPLLEWEFGNVMEMRVQHEPKNYLFTHGHVPFHWDGAFHHVPRFLLFHCIEAPEKTAGGETIFCDTHRIWRHANTQEKAKWPLYTLTYSTDKLAYYGGQIRVPLVQTHPFTHKTILRFAEPVPASMLNPVDVFVENTDENTAKKLIQTLSARCYQPENCYVHTWQQHDFLVADNHALLHARHAFKAFSPRHLRRIQIL